ncbi:hypothetical protein [Paenibacillus polymyxa]|uniref:hypothetical protein n=1 Tax=Paenibacillus polymyxa TaxID=1406 RepID=UPI0020246008|nr:hypothetical protein [Paenibacillus polymyxa]URJ59014.3 hypothetical protein MF622_003614 [Paenibacillus polymyxa]
MIRFEFHDSNNNSDFIKNLLNVIIRNKQDVYWGVGDIEIVPQYQGDYPGSGNHDYREIALKFGEKIEREKLVYVTSVELFEILDDTQSIRSGVFVCFSNSCPFDYNFRPKLETKCANEMQHEMAYLEVRILDGDIFTILSGDSELLIILAETFHSSLV